MLHPFSQFSEEMARSPRDRNQKAKKAAKQNGLQLTAEQKDWKHATCPICLERPHDAVLLLCSSHNKGCRPYMCDTNYHQSNCLEQFKNAYLKEKPTNEVSTTVAPASKKSKEMELACPICRGEVKGWTVVEPARQFLNRKRRTCMHEDCSFIGSYKKLCKHVKSKHPSSKPREVDPVRLAEWMELESEKERQDAISIITGLNTGSIIMGDYVVDPNSGSSDNYTDSSAWSDSSDSCTFSDVADIGSLRRVRRIHMRNGERLRLPNLSANYSGIRRTGSNYSGIRRTRRLAGPTIGRRPPVGFILSAQNWTRGRARSTNDR